MKKSEHGLEERPCLLNEICSTLCYSVYDGLWMSGRNEGLEMQSVSTSITYRQVTKRLTKTDASTTRKPTVPLTSNCPVSTLVSEQLPIRTVPAGWYTVVVCSRANASSSLSEVALGDGSSCERMKPSKAVPDTSLSEDLMAWTIMDKSSSVPKRFGLMIGFSKGLEDASVTEPREVGETTARMMESQLPVLGVGASTKVANPFYSES